MKHFKLTEETKVNILGVTLFRIELIADCKWGKIGEKGGFIQKEDNLSGNAWVSGNAEVYDDARVYGDASVSGDAWNKSPLQIQGTKHYVNECKKGHLKIGCMEFSFSYWKENFESAGKNNGYCESEIKEYGLYIDLAIKISEINEEKDSKSKEE